MKTYYKCVADKCFARVHTYSGSPKIDRKIGKHNHAPDKGKIHSCSLCEDAFSNSGNLKAHVNSAHKGLNEYQCEICGRDFSHTSKPSIHLNDHIKVVHEKIKRSRWLKPKLEIDNGEVDMKLNDGSMKTENDLEALEDWSNGLSKFVKSQKGNNLLSDENDFLYRVQGYSADKRKTFFKCVEENCKYYSYRLKAKPCYYLVKLF